MGDSDVVGRIVVLNEKDYSGIKLMFDDGRIDWFNAKPALVKAALVGDNAPISVGDKVKLKVVGNTKEFRDITKIDPEAEVLMQSESVRVCDSEGNVIYTTDKPKEASKDDLIIREVAAKCASEIIRNLEQNPSVAAWTAWANHIHAWIKGE